MWVWKHGDVSSERAIVRTRNISCLKDGKTIDMSVKGHVSFRGKNGIKGEVVMRNGKILGWAWGAGFVDGIGRGWSGHPSRRWGWGHCDLRRGRCVQNGDWWWCIESGTDTQ